MIEELQEYENKMSQSKNKSVERMYEVMKGYYDNLKQEVNIVSESKVDDDDHELEGILTTLKPNTTPENFKEFLLRKDNNTKSQAWRKISRKIYKDQDDREKRERLEREPELDPSNMKVNSLV